MNAKTSSAGEEEASGTRNETLGEAKRRQVIRVAYVIAALDLTFLFMQMGLMPYLAKSLGLDSVGFGYLQTIFGVLQLVGGYIFGRFADQFGARAALILSCASGSILFLLMTLSTNIPLLFLSRLPGVFMHGIPGAQKVITDVTTPSQRAGALGKLGFCFGVGIIAGSAVGGVLSTKFGRMTQSPSIEKEHFCCVMEEQSWRFLSTLCSLLSLTTKLASIPPVFLTALFICQQCFVYKRGSRNHSHFLS